jgi:hypothetical protein
MPTQLQNAIAIEIAINRLRFHEEAGIARTIAPPLFGDCVSQWHCTAAHLDPPRMMTAHTA